MEVNIVLAQGYFYSMCLHKYAVDFVIGNY